MRDFPLGSFGGLRIVGSDTLVETSEDWSKVRSPGRAKRRRGKHKQNVRHVHTPKDEAVIDQQTGTVYVHPTKLAALKEKLRQEEKLDRAVISGPIVEPTHRRELERVTEADYARAHYGIWSPNLGTKRFDVFPEEMGGQGAQTRLYAAAGNRRGSREPVHWIMPEVERLYASVDFSISVPATSTMEYLPIAFIFPELCFGGRYKPVCAFADADSEKRFYERLRALRLRDAEEDAKWGFKEMNLPPEPVLDPGRWRAW